MPSLAARRQQKQQKGVAQAPVPVATKSSKAGNGGSSLQIEILKKSIKLP